jgi:hypothetical protein
VGCDALQARGGVVVYVPQNPEARITERKAVDPLIELQRNRAHQIDLIARGFDLLARGLREIAHA